MRMGGLPAPTLTWLAACATRSRCSACPCRRRCAWRAAIPPSSSALRRSRATYAPATERISCWPTMTSTCWRRGSTGGPRRRTVAEPSARSIRRLRRLRRGASSLLSGPVVRRLESLRPVRQDQSIPNARRPIRLDWCRLMNDSSVVHEQHRPRLVHREPHSGGAGGIKHVRFTTANSASLDEDHGNEVHSVPVRSFGRRTPDAARGVNAELMRLDEPPLDAANRSEQSSNRGDKPPPRRRIHDLRLDRLEPAFDSAVQRVVGRGLPVRSVRNRRKLARRNSLHEATVPPRTVA